VTTLYDAGVLIAAERNDRGVWAEHRARLEAGLVPHTTAPVVAQVSRSPRQVPLRSFLRGCEIVGFAPEVAHEVGVLLAKSGTTDVVDAHLAVLAARTSGTVITSDPGDLRDLVDHLRPRFAVRSVDGRVDRRPTRKR
jgi:hypothetical protein